MLENLSTSEAVKWAVLVFAAGFIGFFGKSLARAILSMFQKNRGTQPSAKETSGQSERDPTQGQAPLSDGRQVSDPGEKATKDEQKQIKKAMKSQEKIRKKQGME